MSAFKTSIVTIVAAATLGSGIVATASPASARGWGAPVAAGIIGGIAAGAIISSAARPAYAYPYPAYGYAPVPVYNPCYHSRTPVYDAYGNFAGYRGVQVCN